MTKRWIAAALWFYAGWWLGNFVSDFAGVSFLLGPALGIGLAVLIAGDPFHRVWPRPARQTPPPVHVAPEAI
ncbi:MAG TPA: hypothetical protein VK592_02640 [Candidatus Dormibacteraeota bacterium]|nr:hypothetical protein [Candidatus Dormibacteraeota bacterium]